VTTRDLLLLVLSNLRRMKARVAMTAIGVIIGTGAVVVLVSLGAGLQKQATESLFGMGGMDEMMIRNMSYERIEQIGGSGGQNNRDRQKSERLDDEMLEEIRHMEGVIAVTPFVDVPLQGALKLDKQEGWGQIFGVDMNAFVKIVEIDRGKLDMYRGQVVIGASVPETFISWEFGSDERPPPPEMLDQTLYMSSYQFNEENGNVTEATVGRLQVVGILKQHGYTFDYSIFMPLQEAKRLRQRLNSGQPQSSSGNRKEYNQVLVKVEHANQAPIVEQTLTEMGFGVESSRTMLKEINQFFGIVQAIMGGIGAIALLVAAFGIANTMIMAIYERTREIGLMKAIGATNQDVMSVFLAEAGSIGFLGGVGGVLLAMGLNAVINLAGQAFLPGGGLFGGPQQEAAISLTHTPLWLPVFAITFATLIGVISGIYPAIRAAALSPIRALKYE
jgi:putative ABC transport system permease protein